MGLPERGRTPADAGTLPMVTLSLLGSPTTRMHSTATSSYDAFRQRRDLANVGAAIEHGSDSCGHPVL
jgi:hypothetical protein